jgi:PIN domain nuclease of toxin-antitoxin system
MGIKIGNDKLALPMSLREFIDRTTVAYGILVQPILPEHVELISAMPFHHKDPFDRMIAAQAISSKSVLVSGDAIFDRYGVRRIW